MGATEKKRMGSEAKRLERPSPRMAVSPETGISLSEWNEFKANFFNDVVL